MLTYSRNEDGDIIVLGLGTPESNGPLITQPAEWSTFRKKVTTQAIRIGAPFVVETSEGPLSCKDGWLAVDARGYPYPIAADEFDLIYEEV